MFEKLGYDPIKKDLQRINDLSATKDILGEMAYERINSIASSPASVIVVMDKKNAAKYIPQVGQGGLSLPDRDYYLKNDPRRCYCAEMNLSHIERLFQAHRVTRPTESEEPKG